MTIAVGGETRLFEGPRDEARQLPDSTFTRGAERPDPRSTARDDARRRRSSGSLLRRGERGRGERGDGAFACPGDGGRSILLGVDDGRSREASLGAGTAASRGRGREVGPSSRVCSHPS